MVSFFISVIFIAISAYYQSADSQKCFKDLCTEHRIKQWPEIATWHLPLAPNNPKTGATHACVHPV